MPKGLLNSASRRQASQKEILTGQLLLARQQILNRITLEKIWWLRTCTKTFDQHWQKDGLGGPHNPFPPHVYFDYVLDFISPQPRFFPIENQKVRLYVKSRDLMVSWSVVADATVDAMTLSQQEILLQSQTEEKGYELIFYAKTLYEQMEPWMRAEFPLKKGMRMEDFSRDRIEWANGSRLLALPQGETKINSYHPTKLILDEAAIQPDGGKAYGAALPACQSIIGLSSAYPGWYEEMVEPEVHPLDAPNSFYSPVPGIYFRNTSRGIPILWIHFEADPNRGKAWIKVEKANYLYESDWEREQNMRFDAGGGELLLNAILREKADKILIDPEKTGWKPDPNWNYYAGFDWGQSNPTSFHIYGVDKQGCIYAICEHYLTNTAPIHHAPMMSGLRLAVGADGIQVKALSKVQAILADPSIFWNTQSQENSGEFKALVSMFPPEISGKMHPGQRGEDMTTVLKIRQMWQEDDPKFKIICYGGIPSKKSEGTFDLGCPNLVWELMRLRRSELTGRQLMVKNPTEKIVQKHNHAFDDFKYFLSAGFVAPEDSPEEKWRKEVSRLRIKNPEIDFTTLTWLRKEFDSKNVRTGMAPWK